MAKYYLIGILVFMAVVYIGIGIGTYYYYSKRFTKNGERLLDQPVNEQQRTDKMGFGELLVYLSMIGIAGIFAFQIMKRGGSAGAIPARLVILPPVMALFNARKRTGKSMMALVISLMLALFFMMAYYIIGIPQQAPTVTVADTDITITKTTVGEVMEDGFDIYLRQHYEPGLDYEDILSSGVFKKYSADRSLVIEKGVNIHISGIPDALYLLVKDNIVVGSFSPFGSKSKDTVLEDCKIIRFNMDEECIAALRAGSTSCQMSGIELLAPLSRGDMQETFDKKLWHIPASDEKDVTSLFYGIHWPTNSGHLIWDEYGVTIRYDENNKMTVFEFTSMLAD